jgi:hypothetical protein
MGDRRREGQFLSYVGLLHAHWTKFDDARHCSMQRGTIASCLRQDEPWYSALRPSRDGTSCGGSRRRESRPCGGGYHRY